MRILIVDDAGFIIKLISNIIEQEGHTVVGATTESKEVVKLVQEKKPDLIFMDLVMPGMNGLELSKEILLQFPMTKIIACSSLEDQWIKEKAINTGCSDFLLKPFSRDDVINTLKKSMAKQKEVKNG